MDRMGLSEADFQLAVAGMRLAHDVDVEVRALDMDGGILGALAFAADAQVEGDADAVSNHSLSATLYDPSRLISAIGMDCQVEVVYRFEVAALGRWVERVVFSGPVTRPPNRDDALVSVECQDRSAIATRGVPPKTYPAGRAVATIRQIMSEKCGQTRFRGFNEGNTERLEDPVTVGWEEEIAPWVQCQEIARSLDKQLLFDGQVCWLRDYPELAAPAMDLTDYVTGRQPYEATGDLYNRFKVVGKRPKDHTEILTLPRSHQASPQSLAVGGVPQFFTIEETNSKLNTLAKVRTRARRLRDRYDDALREQWGYDVVPVPHLHPLDVLQVGPDVFRLRRWSLPLPITTSAGDMSIGYNKPLGGR